MQKQKVPTPYSREALTRAVKESHLFANDPDVPPSTDEVRKKVEYCKAHMAASYTILAQIHDRCEYRALGYATWEEFTRGEFNWTRGYGYRVIKASQVNRALDAVHMAPITEKHARIVTDLSPEGIVTVVRLAKEIADTKELAPKQRNMRGRITEPILREARAIVMPTLASPKDAAMRVAIKKAKPEYQTPLVTQIALTADSSALVAVWEEGGRKRQLFLPLADVLRVLPR